MTPSSCSPPQTLQHGAPRHEVECSNSIHRHHCCHGIQFAQGLQRVGNALTAGSPRFNHFAHLLGNGDPSIGLRERGLPILTISTTSCGAFPVANCSPTMNNMCKSRTLSNNGLEWSVVPDGPAAAPFLVERKFFENNPSSNSNGSNSRNSCGMSSRGRRGRRDGSLNACNVANVPGAISALPMTLCLQKVHPTGPSSELMLPVSRGHRLLSSDGGAHARWL